VRTYIQGLDVIVNGGIPKRNVVLLSEGPGTGKSIFGYQFLYNGLKRGELRVLVTLEDHPVQVRVSMSQFGWDVTEYEKNGTLRSSTPSRPA
jgi:KaiC/GvpD/RAD55 family RecA-like ATPase